MSEMNVLIGDISPEWLKLAKKASPTDEVFIFSPFITGNMLLHLQENSKAKGFFVVSYLSPEAYLGGSLDIDIIRTLMSRDAKVFHFPKLHAKLMFIRNTAVIGSQNFTDGGQFNLEASAILNMTDSGKEQFLRQITEILKSATILNHKIIDSFVDECEKLRNDFVKLQIQLNEAETNFGAFLFNLQEKHINALNEAKEVKKEFDALYYPISVCVRKEIYFNGNYFSSYYTLRSYLGKEKLNIFQSSKIVENKAVVEYLQTQKRYLCMDLNSLQLFWIRANKYQIGKFGQRCNFTGWRILDGVTGNILIELQNPYEAYDFSNIKISFETKKYGLIELGVLFSGKSFYLQSQTNKILDKFGWDEVWGQLVSPVLTDLSDMLLTPFEYTSKNYGVSPTRLFNDGQIMMLGIQSYNSKLFYTLLDRSFM